MNKDIEIYSSDLSSIKSIDNNYRDRLYLAQLFSNIMQHSASACCKLMNPFLESTKVLTSLNMIEEEMRRVEKGEFNKSSKVPNSLAFSYANRENSSSFISLLVDAWFSFDSPVFYFLIDKENIIKRENIIIDDSKKWLSPSQLMDINPYILCYRESEEDVIWIKNETSISFNHIFNDKLKASMDIFR